MLLLWEVLRIRALIPPDKQRHGRTFKVPEKEPGPRDPLSEHMRWLLATDIRTNDLRITQGFGRTGLWPDQNMHELQKVPTQGREKSLRRMAAGLFMP